MNNRPTQSVADKWRSGLSLIDAMAIYGDNPVSTKFGREARKAMRRSETDNEQNMATIAGNPVAAFSIIHAQVTPLFDLSRARRAQLAALCDRLRANEFDTLGFRVDDRAGDEPVKLPPFMLHPNNAQLARSAFRGHGREYVDVRICTPTAIPAIPAPAKRKRGRPGAGNDIDQVIAVLEGQGVSLDGPPWQQLIRQIHDQGAVLGLAAFGGKGPDAETIRRRLAARMASKPAA